MAERGGNVQPNTSNLGATSIPFRRSKDEPSWWQKLVILLARDLGFFLVLAFWLHAPLDRKITNMEAKALDMEGELMDLRSRTNTLSGRLESLDKYFSDNDWLSKEEFNRKIRNMEAKALDMESELIEYLRSRTNMLSSRLESLDKYFSDYEWLSKEEFNRKITNMEAKALDMEGELIDLRSRTNTLSGRLESLDKYFSDNEWLSKEEFNRFFEDYNKRKGAGRDGNADLNEVAVLGRDIVAKEIEKHAADGLGRIDYALASSGAFVMTHSVQVKVFSVLGIPIWVERKNTDANSVKMITPSFGQPGECFALEGNSGFVVIKLAKAIIPQAVTLEHVDKSIQDDRSSAPKDCRVYGWFSKQKITPNSRMYFLGNFTYDLEKSNAQTFNVTDSSRVIDIIRLDFSSNHGKPSYTCIYRFRVHGYQPDSAVLSV